MAAPDSNAHTRGFSLFEVLIAFFVISVGLVGVVSLQAISKASQHQAMQRSRAVLLADQMMEMIRSNPGGIATYNIGLGGNAVGGGSYATQPSPDCISGGCNPAELAVQDLWVWEQALDGSGVVAADGGGSGAGLIQPRGCIVFTPDAANGKVRSGTLEVIVQWRGLQNTGDAVPDANRVCGDALSEEDAAFRRQVVLSTYVLDDLEHLGGP